MLIYLIALILDNKLTNALTFKEKSDAINCYNTWYGIYNDKMNRVIFKEVDLGD